MDTPLGVHIFWCAGSLFIFIQLPSRRLCSRKGEMYHQRSSLKMLRRSIKRGGAVKKQPNEKPGFTKK